MDQVTPPSPDKGSSSGSPQALDSTNSPQAGLGKFWQELRRRKVMRVAITYAVISIFPSDMFSSKRKGNPL
jgi:hypothetical protein